MWEYGFSLTGILPYKNKIYDFVIIRENTGQWKPVISHILWSVSSWKTKKITKIKSAIDSEKYFLVIEIF